MTCPYCQTEFGLKDAFEEEVDGFLIRESFTKCPECRQRVYEFEDPTPFKSHDLTAMQAACIVALRQLDLWVFAYGSQEDYQQMHAFLHKRFKRAPGPADVVWGLMNKSLVERCEDEFEIRALRELMQQFKEFEARQKVVREFDGIANS